MEVENEQIDKLQEQINKLTKACKLAIVDINNLLSYINKEQAFRCCDQYCKNDGNGCFVPSEDDSCKCKNFVWRYEDMME